MARRKGTLLDVQPGSYDVFHEEPEGNDSYSFTIETSPDPLVRQEILDDWNVKILPSKKKQIQIQRRNTDPRTYYRREMIFSINSKRILTA